MKEIMAKLKEYLQMETEIPFGEFKSYYEQVIKELNGTFQDMDQKNCFDARYTCLIIQGNADARAKTDKGNMKQFKKISAKCAFWIEAIDYRLQKDGLTTDDIENAMRGLNEKMV
ncbi:hypothetical protein Sgly_1857 [Syntrophobotulus glycolicus DSM 8271]|uniref:Uncharacterized protein n=1 Tax=Syntrophobotulus glycolicus (strain DSM 8271 / FlGlyR) TaxID=645991 RepID=F0T067_SYNGF|nr:hypothetical protein [Syntrophobotulus glycolicus]ADY56154.1 hypothetical protein Sgly_1857 [Syntrophobotulus glycolicus DSM 8271]